MTSLPCATFDKRSANILFEPPDFDRLQGKRASSLETEQLLGACQSAVRAMRDCAPGYLSWVDRVVRRIIPVRAENSTIFSGSWEHSPGILAASFPCSAVELAEMLIHESSHQYFYLLCRLGDVDDGSDSNLYYSPVKQCGRPIRAIALAYHAFANVLLFCRECRARELADGGYCERNEEVLLPQLDQLESALLSSSALTTLGRSLWQPLAERIHSPV